MIDGAVHEISSPPAAEKPFDLRQVDLGVPEEVYAALQQEVAYFEQLDGYHDSIDPVERAAILIEMPDAAIARLPTTAEVESHIRQVRLELKAELLLEQLMHVGLPGDDLTWLATFLKISPTASNTEFDHTYARRGNYMQALREVSAIYSQPPHKSVLH